MARIKNMPYNETPLRKDPVMKTETETVVNEVTRYTATVRIPRPIGKLVSKLKDIRTKSEDTPEDE